MDLAAVTRRALVPTATAALDLTIKLHKMNLSTRPVRTYSRRQSEKNTAGSASPSPDRSSRVVSSGRQTEESERPRKRRTLINSGTDTDGPEESVKSAKISKAYTSPAKPDRRNSNRSHELPTEPSSPTPESSLEAEHQLKGKAATTRLVDNMNKTSTLPGVFRDPSPSTSDTSASRPATPKKLKDLSRIFEAVSPQRRMQSAGSPSQFSPGRSGITKKMLGRSKTESFIESSTLKETLQLTPKARSFVVPRKLESSLHEDISPSCSPKKLLSRNPSLSSLPSSAQHPQRETLTNTRTYAGSSRSFLVALPTAALLTGNGHNGMKQNTLDEDDEEFLRDSYAELRKRYGVDNSEDIDADSADAASTGEGLSLYNPLSSITDLRSKGESRRFRDEVGYLFEGLEPSGALSIRRSSAFDIVSKLCDQDFWKKARAAGLIMDIWDRLREAGAGNGDKVLDPILCCFVALASEDPRDVSLLATQDDFVETIIQLMAAYRVNDPFSSTISSQLKLSKAEVLTLDRLRNIISAKSSIVHEECQPSTRLLLSCALASVPSLAFQDLSTILDSVSGDLTNVCKRLAAYMSGLALFDDSAASHDKLCFTHIYNCLTILDLYLLEVEAPGSTLSLTKAELRRRHRALPSGLVALIVVADIVSRNNSSDALRSQASRCSEFAFRILINLTNGNPTWTDAVAADPYTLPTTIRLVMTSYRYLLSFGAKKLATDETVQDASTSAMDRLCLALALLTNLLQERDNLAYSLQNIIFDPTCEGQRSCLLGCRCANSVSAVTSLVNVYISFLKDEDEELAPDFHFLRGHLSVLVGLILLQLHNPSSPSSSQASSLSTSTPTTVQSIIDTLPGSADPSGRRWKLDTLIENVDAFSKLYASLTSKMSGNRNERSSQLPSESERDEAELGSEDTSDDIVQRPGQSGCDSDVVAGVAASLCALRDKLRRSQ